MRSSSSTRQSSDSAAQSAAVGVRSSGSEARAWPMVASGMPTRSRDADEGDPAQGVAAVAALVAGRAAGPDQALRLVEVQRGDRDPGPRRQLADGELATTDDRHGISTVLPIVCRDFHGDVRAGRVGERERGHGRHPGARERGRLQRPHPARPRRDPGADRARHRDAQPEEVPHVERERLAGRPAEQHHPPAGRQSLEQRASDRAAGPVEQHGRRPAPAPPTRAPSSRSPRRPGPARSWPDRRPGRPPWRRPRSPPGPAGSRGRRPRRAGARRRPPRAPPRTGSPRPYGPFRSAPPRPRTRATQGSRAARSPVRRRPRRTRHRPGRGARPPACPTTDPAR